MHRYRVNYQLLAILIAGLMATSASAYGIWFYQVNRNAERLKNRAIASEEDGKLIEARDSLKQYVSLVDDDEQALVRLAKIAKRIADDDGASMEDRRDAFGILVNTVRDTDDEELRRELIDMYLTFGEYLDAMQHIKELQHKNADNPELTKLQVKCQFGAKNYDDGLKAAYAAIGYDRRKDEFDRETATAPAQIEIYTILASYLRNEKNDELADRVIETMLETNPDSAKAYLEHYLTQVRQNAEEEIRQREQVAKKKSRLSDITDEAEREAAQAEIDAAEEEIKETIEAAQAKAIVSLDKAYQLEPSNPDVLLHKGVVARLAEDFEGALEYLRKAKEVDPDRPQYIYQEALTLVQMQKIQEAIDLLDAGLDRFDLQRAWQLSILKVGLLLDLENYPPIDEEVTRLRKMRLPVCDALADFHRARVLYQQEKWLAAARILQSARPRLYAFNDYQAMAGVMQASCYRRLGQRDLAKKVLEQVQVKFPTYQPALERLRELNMWIRPVEDTMPTDELERMVRAELRKPEAEQDFDHVYVYINKVVRDRNLIDTRRMLLEAQVALLRGKYMEAQDIIREAFRIDPDDLTVRLAAVRLLQLMPGKGPAIALQLLEQIIERSGDEPRLRIIRADLLVAARDDNLVEQLKRVTQGMEGFSTADQAQVWSSVGAQFKRLGRFDEAWDCLEKAIALVPSNLPTRVFLFEIALGKNDDALMREAQARLLDFLQDESDPAYLLTEVKRRMVRYSSGNASREELAEAREMLNRALEERESWHELHIASGQLAILLEKDVDLALRSLDRALQDGPAVTNAVVLQTRLLAENGRASDAYDKMQFLPAGSRTQLLGKIEAEVLQAVGRSEEAFTSAYDVAKTRPDDAATQVWFSEMARLNEKYKEAETALLRGIELRSDVPEYWSKLVTLYYRLKDPQKVFSTLRNAALELDAEFLPHLAAKNYELQGRWQAAEDIYQMAYSNRIDDPVIARTLADFYIRWRDQDQDNMGKSAIYINKILRAANEGRIEQTDNNAMWARRQAAHMLAKTGDYRDSMKAEKMLAGAMEFAKDKEQIAGQLADVLSMRGDPASRLRAVSIFQRVRREQGLTKLGDMRLGRLLFDVGEWVECDAHMADVVSLYPNDLGVRTGYIRMLLDRREFNKAERQLTQIGDRSKSNRLVARLQARLAAARGDKQQVRRLLVSLTRDPRVPSEKRVELARTMADLAERVGDYEYAEQMLQYYLQSNPEETSLLARLIALHGDPQRGAELLKAEFSKDIDWTLMTAVHVLRERRPLIGDLIDDQIQDIVDRAVNDDPDSASRLVLRAECMEVMHKYDEAIDAYEDLLQRDDLPRTIHATTNNNLAFLYALRGENAERALALVNEAIDMVGPLSEILDTRAVAHLVLGNQREAAQDMAMAIRISPTPGKYFHLAQAQVASNQPQEALQSWESGLKLGMAVETISPLEEQKFQELKSQIEALQTPSAQL